MMSLLLEEGFGMSEKDRVVSHKRQCSLCYCGTIVHGFANAAVTFFVLYKSYIRPMKGP